MTDWVAAGADGFGIGSNLYRAGKLVDDVVRDARLFIDAWHSCS
jgi:2-dehydro-3-deoxyphosphogalactonate aldolase